MKYYQCYYKDQNKKSLALEEVDMSMQENDMNRSHYQKKWTNLRGQVLQAFTEKITQRQVVVAQTHCFNQLGNGIND